jgi:hypothetical protein
MAYDELCERASVKFGPRATKFTPERIQQIRDLIARGTSCEEIAALIGVTVGTLKVTCSRLGVSLRRPRPRDGVRLVAQRDVVRRLTVSSTHTATFTITVRYNGEEQATSLPLTPAMIGPLALEASSQDLKLGEFAGDLVLAAIKKGLIYQVLGE